MGGQRRLGQFMFVFVPVIAFCLLPSLIAHSAEPECNIATVYQMKGKAREECHQQLSESIKRFQKLGEESDRRFLQEMSRLMIQAAEKLSNCITEWAPKYAVVSEEPTSVLVEVVASRCQSELSSYVSLSLDSDKNSPAFKSADLRTREQKARIARIIVETRAAARQQQSPPPRPTDRGT